MKTIAITTALAILSAQAMSADYHRGYVKKDGTYVAPHYQTSPDRNPYNNYSTQGNINPYTGKAGTRDPYQVQQQYNDPKPQQFRNPYGSGARRGNGW